MLSLLHQRLRISFISHFMCHLMPYISHFWQQSNTNLAGIVSLEPSLVHIWAQPFFPQVINVSLKLLFFVEDTELMFPTDCLPVHSQLSLNCSKNTAVMSAFLQEHVRCAFNVTATLAFQGTSGFFGTISWGWEEEIRQLWVSAGAKLHDV